MSKVSIERVVLASQYSVPLFVTFSEDSSLYMLVNDADFNKERPYRLLSVSNGHMQAIGEYRTIDEFLSMTNIQIVDVNIQIIEES